ncbi:MAG: hypothetical protein J6R80_02845 [Kiritimatiellae bacterium]|jgi:hypothetical protein|nr:hypothetical protein [Kiritimatiellia bacterium]
MKSSSIFLLGFVFLLALPGCRRTDVREMTVSMPGLVEADKPKIVAALSKYAGVKKDSFRWDMEAKTLTLTYDSMQVAQANIRYAIDENGIKVAFPEKVGNRAGH